VARLEAKGEVREDRSYHILLFIKITISIPI